MYHFEYSGNNSNYKELSEIDALGTDFYSVLEKYFRARAFHNVWRHEKGLPDHMNALRSARLWFDAAYKLVETKHSIFRMDEDILNIVEDYEDRKMKDKDLKSRWRKYAREGYISGMKVQLAVMDYIFVGKIPKLIMEGQLDEAARLNSTARCSLTEAEPIVIKAVNELQGVDEDLLMKNKLYILEMQR